MSFRELCLRADMPDGAVTEIMYEVASCRADGIDLLKINIDNELSEIKRIVSALLKTLKTMKQKGSIQFYATKESFDVMSTEAVFLQNKYPEHFSEGNINSDDQTYIYVKI